MLNRKKHSQARCITKRHAGTYSLHKVAILHSDRAFVGTVTHIHEKVIHGQKVLLGLWKHDNRQYRVKRYGKNAWNTCRMHELVHACEAGLDLDMVRM